VNARCNLLLLLLLRLEEGGSKRRLLYRVAVWGLWSSGANPTSTPTQLNLFTDMQSEFAYHAERATSERGVACSSSDGKFAAIII